MAAVARAILPALLTIGLGTLIDSDMGTYPDKSTDRVLPSLSSTVRGTAKGRLDLDHASQPGGRRALLSTGHRSDFLKQAYQEAVQSKLAELGSMRHGRRILQVTNPVVTCGLQGQLAQAAAVGVSVEDITDLFLQILLSPDIAAAPFSFGGIGGNRSNSATCNLVRLRLQALINARVAGATAGGSGSSSGTVG